MGTYCVFESPVAAFGEDSLAGRALDNRASCMNLVQALQHGYRGRLTCAFTVPEMPVAERMYASFTVRKSA